VVACIHLDDHIGLRETVKVLEGHAIQKRGVENLPPPEQVLFHRVTYRDMSKPVNVCLSQPEALEKRARSSDTCCYVT